MAETMTGWERYWAAISREETPDRVPVVPLIWGALAAFMGMSQGDAHRDYQGFINIVREGFEDVGGWDCVASAPFDGPMWNLIMATVIRTKSPGIELPDDYVMQVHESQVLKYEDYDKIIEQGYDVFAFNEGLLRVMDITAEELKAKAAERYQQMEQALNMWESYHVKSPYAIILNHPFFNLSLGRSLIPFTEDLYYRPDKVEKCLQIMTDEIIAKFLKEVKHTGIKSVLLVEERASASLYPLEKCERFWIPYTKQIVEALWDERVITTFHLDTNWTKNVPLFKKYLPKGSFCLQFDGTSDMIEAKKFMGDYCSFHGDVPAILLAYKSKEDVEDYCKRLIKEVGYDGGFVLSSGCEVPVDCKKENFIAMLETAKKSFY